MSQADSIFSPPLWEEDEHFKILAHPSQILLWSCDGQGHFEFVSPSWLAFTGRQMEQERGLGWLDRVHPEDRIFLWDSLSDSLNRETGFRRKFRLQRQDSLYCWLAMEAMTRHDDDGRFLGFTGFCLDITPYQEGQADMQLSNRQITDLLRQTQLLALSLDAAGRVRFANGRLCQLLGKEEGAVTDSFLFDNFLVESEAQPPENLYPGGTQAPDFPPTLETRTRDAGGRLIFWHTLALRDYSGNLSGAVLIGEDITERRETEEKLLLTSKVFETTDQAMVITDRDCRILSVNSAFSRLTGYSREEALGQNPRILQSGRHGPEFYREMWESLLRNGHWQGDIWDRRKDGSVYPKFLSISILRDDQDAISHFCGIFYDITARKQVEEKLEHLAHYDQLTDLPNRALLRDNLERALAKATRAGTRVALLYIDLDHFKHVNDTLGHQAGDDLLREIARRLKGCVRAYDTVARIGGDEFVVLLPDIVEVENIAGVAGKIVDALGRPVPLEGREVICTPSIGISLYPDDHHNSETLLKHADQAMYRVKASGRRGFRFFGEAAAES